MIKLVLYWVAEIIVVVGVFFFLYNSGLPIALDIIVALIIAKIMDFLLAKKTLGPLLNKKSDGDESQI